MSDDDDDAEDTESRAITTTLANRLFQAFRSRRKCEFVGFDMAPFGGVDRPERPRH